MKVKAKYIYCKLKNIAVNTITGFAYYKSETLKLNPHIDFTNHIPDNCIRLHYKSKACGRCTSWCDECNECW